MTREQLQQECEWGQRQLMETRYLEAEQTLADAEALAWGAKDYDTLARLYMPLQETRRQIRQRCGEGTVKLDYVAADAEHSPKASEVLVAHPHGQLLVAGWASVQPAVELRQLARGQKRYVETFLAATFPMVGGARAVVMVPLPETGLPDGQPRSIDALLKLLPPHCVVFGPNELPEGSRKGSSQTYGEVMALWEQLHRPFLAAADQEADPVRKMEGYRKTIRVDSACELAHQKLSAVARELSRGK